MSANCPDVLAALRQRERDLELQACSIRARIEEIRETIAMIEHPPRRRPGRPNKIETHMTVVTDRPEDETEISEGTI